MKRKSNELDIKRIIEKHMGLEISRKQIRKFIQKYNNRRGPISKTIIEIIKDPSEFIALVYDSPEIKLTNYVRTR